jgi:hypothetical protein
MNRLLACLLLAFCSAAFGQTWPSKPVRIVVAYPPGGGIDVMARQLADKLQAAWGQPVVVENKPGANTIVAADAVARSAPDGHTVLMTTDATFSFNPHLYAKLPYDARRDFIPATMLVLLHQFLVAHPSLPANSLSELIALAKAKPGTINYASYGSGSQPHLAGEIFHKAGIDLVHAGTRDLARGAGGRGRGSSPLPASPPPHRNSRRDASRRSRSAGPAVRRSFPRCRRSPSSATRRWRRTPGSGSSFRRVRRARRCPASTATAARSSTSPSSARSS